MTAAQIAATVEGQVRFQPSADRIGKQAQIVVEFQIHAV
jgi:hypothetical protein